MSEASRRIKRMEVVVFCLVLPDGTLLSDPARPLWQNRPIDIRHPEFPD